MPRTAISNTRNTPDNLITNGSFEYAPAFTAATTTTARWIDGTAGGTVSGADAAKYNWFTSFNGSCSAQFDTSVKYRGTTSMKVSTTATNAIAVVHTTSSDYPMLASGSSNAGYMKIQPNTSYVISGWMKTNYVSGDGRGAFIRVADYTGTRAAITSYSTTFVKTTTDWTFYSQSFTTGSTAQYARVSVVVWGQDAPATLIMDAWFDDITLVKSPVQTRSTTNILRRKPVGGNIVYNGDFEILPTTNTAMTTSGSTFIDGTAAGSSTDATYGWYVYNFAGTRSAQFDTTTKYQGNGSLKLTTNAGSVGVAYCANVDNDASWSRNNLPCEPNTTYNLSVWVKTNVISGSATTGAAVIIAERNKTNATVSGGGKTIVTGIITTTDWTQYTTTITTQASTRFLNPQFQLVGNNGTATLNIEAWFDNLTITQAIPRREVDNLVFNGKFEYAPPFTAATTGSRWIDGTTAGSLTNSAYGWRLSVGAGTPSAQYDNTVYKNGVNSLKVTSGVGGWAEVVNGTTKDFFVPVLPSTSYTLSGWMKTEYISGDANIGAQMFAYEYTGAIVGGSLRTTTAVKTTTDWTQYSVTFTTASTARYVSIGNSIKGHTGTATLSMNAWYDDITLVKN